MSRKTAIVTGFRPFLDVAKNPSAVLVESLEHNSGWINKEEIRVETVLLDTVYAGLSDTLENLLAEEPDVLVLTGFSSLATGLKIETRATSLCSPNYADASGWRPQPTHDPVTESANEAVDFPQMIDALRDVGVPARLSDDAGEYVCNHSYWHALDIIGSKNLETRSVFVHLPAIEGMDDPPGAAGTMALETMRQGMGTIIRRLVDQ